MVLWLLLSGHFTALLIALGVASSLAAVSIARRMDLIDHEGHPVHLGWRGLTYLPWLIWEIVKANIDVARIILSPSLPISPVLFRLHADQKTGLGHVIYANSITLTPGTVTVDLVGHVLDVHALTREAADELENGRMNARVTEMEGHEEGAA